MLLWYGTTYFKNNGENYYMVEVTAPRGTAFANSVLNAQDSWAVNPLSP
jgi:hypothetical protein